ncbi:MAG: hypothetical protein J5861_08820 [Desulfovibrio sp.]|nr:hypothetical protein [Desulfovibrio sp.]
MSSGNFLIPERSLAESYFTGRKKRFLTAVFLLWSLGLGACDSSTDVPSGSEMDSVSTGGLSRQEDIASQQQRSLASDCEKATQSVTPPRTEELARADSLVAFANAASLALSSGKYAQTDVLAAYTEYYLAEWQLAKCPKIDSELDAALAAQLVPPSGLFASEHQAKMAARVKSMDRAIDDMRKAYRALEAYVTDPSIRDNGLKGRQLGERVLRAHRAYRSARDDWMRLVESESGPAEELLLRDHPLRRQIRAANAIFAIHRQVQELLAQPHTDNKALASLVEELQSRIVEAERPPFRASPSVERQYRQFLKDAAAYRHAMERGMAEGFHNAVRQEMNNAVLACRNAYNAFVRQANGNR